MFRTGSVLFAVGNSIVRWGASCPLCAGRNGWTPGHGREGETARNGTGEAECVIRRNCTLRPELLISVFRY